MKPLLPFGLLLLLVAATFSPSLFAASAYVQSVGAGANSGTGVTTAEITTTGGNTIHYVAVCRGQQTTATASDSKSNTYTENERTAGNTGDGDGTLVSGRAYNITGGASHTFTITFAVSCNLGLVLAVAEYSGLITTDPFDVDAGDTWSNTATPTSNATATTNQANELVVGSFGAHNVSANTVTAGTGFTKRIQTNAPQGWPSASIEDKNISSTGTQTADFVINVARDSAVQVATYKDAAGAGAPAQLKITGAVKISGAVRKP